MASSTIPAAVVEEARRRLRGSLSPAQQFRERLIEGVLAGCGVLSIVITVGIAVVLVLGTIEFFTFDEHVPYNRQEFTTPDGKVGLREVYAPMKGADIWHRVRYFFTGTEWTGNIPPHRYGILPLLSGTLWVALIAGALALPIGLTTAIYLSEYARPRVRAVAKPTLELLAGIPTVVYGYFAITVVTPLLAEGLTIPWLNWHIPGIPGLDNNNNLLSGGIVVGIMIIPMVASLSEDALRAVPRSLREASIALGANKFETSVKVVVPAALSGVLASFILAISRAVGETMAVTLACGSRPALEWDPRRGAATMTSFIAQVTQGDAPQGTTIFASLFAVGLVLFVITLLMNILAQRILRRYRQVYQ
ncbi:MAG: phosphate ABC transporter permease subunit PstC [Gemmataceae bacterium]|nr:phosphate ABC transporter permease subunit PstC [Gemmataceae bacterium]